MWQEQRDPLTDANKEVHVFHRADFSETPQLVNIQIFYALFYESQTKKVQNAAKFYPRLQVKYGFLCTDSHGTQQYRPMTRGDLICRIFFKSGKKYINCEYEFIYSLNYIVALTAPIFTKHRLRRQFSIQNSSTGLHDYPTDGYSLILGCNMQCLPCNRSFPLYNTSRH